MNPVRGHFTSVYGAFEVRLVIVVVGGGGGGGIVPLASPIPSWAPAPPLDLAEPAVVGGWLIPLWLRGRAICSIAWRLYTDPFGMAMGGLCSSMI